MRKTANGLEEFSAQSWWDWQTPDRSKGSHQREASRVSNTQAFCNARYNSMKTSL